MNPSEDSIKILEDKNFDLWYLCGIKDIELNAFRIDQANPHQFIGGIQP